MPWHGGNIVCLLLIETAEAGAQIEAICAVEGVDALMIAPYDLSNDLGCQGDFVAPAFTAAMERVETAARADILPPGGVAREPARARWLRDRGYWLILPRRRRARRAGLARLNAAKPAASGRSRC